MPHKQVWRAYLYFGRRFSWRVETTALKRRSFQVSTQTHLRAGLPIRFSEMQIVDRIDVSFRRVVQEKS